MCKKIPRLTGASFRAGYLIAKMPGEQFFWMVLWTDVMLFEMLLRFPTSGPTLHLGPGYSEAFHAESTGTLAWLLHSTLVCPLKELKLSNKGTSKVNSLDSPRERSNGLLAGSNTELTSGGIRRNHVI
jgi:hypothetical protein